MKWFKILLGALFASSILICFLNARSTKLHKENLSGIQMQMESQDDFKCVLKSGKTAYRIGERPDLKVEIWNNTTDTVFLVGSLDGSDRKWRLPYCYFNIEWEKILPVEITSRRCGNVNNLRLKDFIEVAPKHYFDPYMEVDEAGFFPNNMLDRFNFLKPGLYTAEFYYDTRRLSLDSAFVERCYGDLKMDKMFHNTDAKADSMKLLKLKSVPQLLLKSNKISFYYTVF
jgi:hypothetical protein